MPVITIIYRHIYFFILRFFPPNVGRAESSKSEVQNLETATVKPLFLQVLGLIPGKCRWALKFI